MRSDQKVMFVCDDCGAEFARWSGQCPNCGSWNSLQERVMLARGGGAKTKVAAKKAAGGSGYSDLQPVTLDQVEQHRETRFLTGLEELDRVLGGGIVAGSLVLLGGEPGAGKSTLLLQICEYLAQKLQILYVSGEESTRQIKLRADRLGVKNPNLKVLAETDIVSICNLVAATAPDLVIIDSIQTMNLEELASSPGSVAQVRECTSLLMKTAKTKDIPVLIIGHVNKDGAIAGPKVLEHIVDTVLYFEGDKHFTHRILRAVKNRYGSTNEIGVFDMTGHGLKEVKNPSMMLLTGRPLGASGTCVACNMEGSRPLLSEVQALVTKSGFAVPRRVSTGFDYNRTNLLIAVMEKKAGFFFGNLDVYINVVGGIKLDEPGADLAVLLAMYSSLKDQPVAEEVVAIGEVGLTGEVRAVAQLSQRVSEAKRLGFGRIVVPQQNLDHEQLSVPGIQVIGARTIKDAFKAAF
ncbi:DNA repair protein RadA [Neobittarella massiliensis]|uniref:DNA repair protein RadA n=2 Tax=Oscillospiraceae TaxID=216572 RepID=A0A8J6IN77_9FIRM|nr:DNA repair protein RadA [Neobittarella massiliensis]MBC3515785.1 DNA repair protein RadA [Neobittarella massiliensis]SCJ46288.1 DNA repair protein RadA [uncultured Anaerotruncus sp.]